MTDTSGKTGFGSAGKRIRREYSSAFNGRPGSGARRESKAQTLSPVAGSVLKSLWQYLHEANLLDVVLMPPELVYYLKEMARFIDTAKRLGLSGVSRTFEVRETSPFLSIRRVVSSRAPGNSQSEAEGSEHHNRAGSAFVAGSARWAQEMTGINDPTQISLRVLVEKIGAGHNYDRAIMLSAKLILQEYGQRVIRSPIRDDDTWGKRAMPALLAEFQKQLDLFFAKHNSSADWALRRLEQTLEELASSLLDAT